MFQCGSDEMSRVEGGKKGGVGGKSSCPVVSKQVLHITVVIVVVVVIVVLVRWVDMTKGPANRANDEGSYHDGNRDVRTTSSTGFGPLTMNIILLIPECLCPAGRASEGFGIVSV